MISGSVSRWNSSSRSNVLRDSSSNVGSARNDACSSLSRAAVAANTLSVFSISERSWSSRSLSAPKTMPVLATSWDSASSWRLSTSTIVAVSSANGARLPSASLRSCPRPSPMACACVCIHSWKFARVSGSNERRISSSSTVSDTCVDASSPPSGIVSALLLPGVSST